MPLTTRQQYLGGVMVLAAIAFAYDRATGGKPAEADAAAVASDLLIAQPTAIAHNADAGSAAAPRLGARLADAADAERLDPLNAVDAFLVPDSWPIIRRPVAPVPQPATAPARMTDAQRERALADEFAQKHHLDAVMARTNGGYAIINGQGVRVGRTVDHFKLVSVTSSSATFERGQTRIEVRLTANSDLRLDGTTIENHSTPAKSDE